MRRDKLREKMQRSAHGWRRRDLQRLYHSHGFEKHEGGKHTMYIHADYPHLWATVSRSKDVKSVYVRDALRLIERLETEIENLEAEGGV
ncbi:hypothetical protein [Candidatus Palauibacter sp.]|uniref:hypothetical protein n=1 Tax=Candidatus Palauibacter sp. TaxID=3101350 RepID=UPI003B029F89